MQSLRLAIGVCAALLSAAPAPVAQADAGASGASADLAEALWLREYGEMADAQHAITAALTAASDDAARWEARLAQAELDLATGALAKAEADARALLSDAETIFGPDTGRQAPVLVLQAQAQSAAGNDTAATGLLLRAARLARAAYAAGQGSDGAPPQDVQTQADLFATLAALAEHLVDTGEGGAAALLAEELAILGGAPPPGLPPRWQDAVVISGLVQLQAGRPIEALVRALPLVGLEDEPQTDRAFRLADRFLTDLDALATASGDPDTVIAGWLDAAEQRRSEIAGAEEAFTLDMQSVMVALGSGDAVAADAAGRIALETVRSDDPVVTTAYNALLASTMRAGRPDLAEAWALRIAQMPPAYLASLDADPLALMSDLAAQLRSRGAFPEAIALGEAVTVIAPLRTQAGQSDWTITALTQLAATYTDAGRTREAGEIFDRALALIDADGTAALNADLAQAALSARVGRALLRQDLGDFDGAVADLKAARSVLQETEEGRKPEAWLFVSAATRDAHLARGDPAAAEAALREAAARVSELAGDLSPQAAEAWFALAQQLHASGREDAAAEPLSRALQASQAALSADDPLALRIAVLGGTDDLIAQVAAGGQGAALALAEAATGAAQSGDLTGAVAFLDRGIAALDAEAPMRAYFQAGKGELLMRHGDAQAALPALREATRALTRAERRDEPRARDHLPAHVSAAISVFETLEGVAAMNAFTEAFQVAQRVDDLSAGAALGRATARLLGAGPEADSLARALETAERQFETAREVYLAALSARDDVIGPRQSLTAAQGALDEVRSQIRTAFPAYAGLADPRPVDLAATAQLLGPDEVLLLYASAPGDSADAPTGHVFAITADSYTVAPLPPRAELARIAQDLRCAAALTDRRCGLGGGATRGAFSLTAPDAATLPEFDFALARAAWDALFAPVGIALDGKTSVIIVPDRTLSAMPFHLALTEAPDATTNLRSAPWLLRDMAVTVVPSVSSLAALRNRDLRPNAADLPFLGVGDPLIGTQIGGPLPYDCGETAADLLLAQPLLPAGGPILRDGGTADPVALSALPALPDTRCELLQNAAVLGPASRVVIQAEATERYVKDLSASGELARFRILSFATHGLIAGELGAANAGLVLTPPLQPDAVDDGLLSVAEIAGLRIDADFVILSACNTASGSSRSSEGLAGLASAFFLAGARGVLVSHWPVYSDAATRLTTGMVAALDAPDRPGRAEALRRSVLRILDDPASPPRALHPAYWAPFLVVGDGRAGQG